MSSNLRKCMIICAILVFSCLSCVDVKADSKKIGNFRYTYTEYKSSKIWITGIEPVQGKDVSVLRIPSMIDGKKVVKLGNLSDNKINDSVDVRNLFGLCYNDDAEGQEGQLVLFPKTRAEKVAKIKKIVIPKSVTKITPACFANMQEGKSIDIPKGITKNVKQICETKWKKVRISELNPKFKIRNGLLLSKNGKVVYGIASSTEKVMVPKDVKKIEGASLLFSNITAIDIPDSVKKIDFSSGYYRTDNIVKILVSKKNKYYAVAGNSLYSKKTGRLLVATAESSVFTIPNGVTCVKQTFFAGKEVNRIIIPSSVKKIDTCWGADRGNLTLVFKSKTPPIIEDTFVFGVTIHVPKGCKTAYRKATQEAYGEVKIYEM